MVEPVFRQANLYIYFGEETKCCENKGLEKETRKFFQGVISFNQEVGICKKCGKIFILKTNEENLRLFCDYKIFNALTGEKIKQSLTSNWNRNNITVIYPSGTGESGNGGTIFHPYQGGGCSGK